MQRWRLPIETSPHWRSTECTSTKFVIIEKSDPSMCVRDSVKASSEGLKVSAQLHHPENIMY